MNASAPHLITGSAGEEATAAYLRKKGWRVAARNWRPAGHGGGVELDIVAYDGATLVFVEVKTRSEQSAACSAKHPARESLRDVPAYAAFTEKKRARLVKAAQSYLSEHEAWAVPCRFDLITVACEPGAACGQKAASSHIVEHYEHVIEFGNLMGGRHAAWQPW